MAKLVLTFIIGGVRSGKSAYAENLAYSFLINKTQRLIYIATSKVSDEEMSFRIRKHQKDRLDSGFQWMTWEQERHLEQLLPAIDEGDVIVVDCLTTLLANELFIEEENWRNIQFQYTLQERITSFFEEGKFRNIKMILVSNELLYDGISYDEGTVTYLKLLGNIHQHLVKLADEVYLIEAGISQKMKGCGNHERNYASRDFF